jgi:hypothetical protein
MHSIKILIAIFLAWLEVDAHSGFKVAEFEK